MAGKLQGPVITNCWDSTPSTPNVNLSFIQTAPMCFPTLSAHPLGCSQTSYHILGLLHEFAYGSVFKMFLVS